MLASGQEVELVPVVAVASAHRHLDSEGSNRNGGDAEPGRPAAWRGRRLGWHSGGTLNWRILLHVYMLPGRAVPRHPADGVTSAAAAGFRPRSRSGGLSTTHMAMRAATRPANSGLRRNRGERGKGV